MLKWMNKVVFVLFVVFFVVILSGCKNGYLNIEEAFKNEEPPYEFENILDVSDEKGTPQDIEIFDNYLFVASSSKDRIRIYSLDTKELVFEKTMWIAHGSSMQFSNEYYDKKDSFPLLYTGGLKNFSIQVLRIIHDEDNWDIVSVKIIKIGKNKPLCSSNLKDQF